MRNELITAAFASVVVAAAFAYPHDRLTAKHTYNFHVRPIFAKHCAQCHVPGGIAPMSLMTYDDASPWAAAIRTEVLDRKMPPFLPEEGAGNFHGASYLSAKEIEAIVDWATGGTPKGDPSADAASPGLSTQNDADRILEIPLTRIGADIMQDTKCIPLDVDQSRLFRMIVFLPGNSEIVHKAAITSSRDCAGATMPLAVWLPGHTVAAAPPGFGWAVAQPLYLSIHYRKTWRHDGKEVQDRSRIGLYYAPRDAKRIQSALVDGTYIAPANIRVVSIYVTSPQRIELNGRPVLEIEKFDPAWNGKYVFREPLELRKGDRITGNAWIEFLN